MRRKPLAITLDHELELLLDGFERLLDTVDDADSKLMLGLPQPLTDSADELRRKLTEFQRLLLAEQTARAS